MASICSGEQEDSSRKSEKQENLKIILDVASVILTWTRYVLTWLMMKYIFEWNKRLLF